MKNKYVRPFTLFEKIAIGLSTMVLIVLTFILYKLIRRWWINYQANKDRSYNVFDKAELGKFEVLQLKRWQFSIPKEQQALVTQQFLQQGHDYELILEFTGQVKSL
eukprot:CAMPEP_0202965248 /NCGR_PEP_ID=MMETSP1396-20130829/9286_1 /ASSEMBLY_ACC=CAM_ASM_000872 /TAXON_ID= /ORGANISM="Pseudokeronopsis sp., Strain Brazil" /LENGTH=105 /DNA_ID=CAMNT_0049687905 /DNA_START=528 /DNA_END=845 /DNA_ORIENTATION=-